MTVERFKTLVAAPGDKQPLIRELSVMPVWRAFKASISLRFEDGRSFDEECLATSKTVEGRYIVVSLESKLYKQTVNAITGYDAKAKAIRNWGLFGEKLAEATVVIDPEHKTSASSASLGDGLTEIAVSSFNEDEVTTRASVFKDGALFMTRIGKAHPIVDPETGGEDDTEEAEKSPAAKPER